MVIKLRILTLCHDCNDRVILTLPSYISYWWHKHILRVVIDVLCPRCGMLRK